MLSRQQRPFLLEKKLKRVRRYLDVKADHCDNPPKNIITGQGEQDNRPNFFPVLISFLPGQSALQLVSAGLMYLCRSLLYWCRDAGLHQGADDQRNGDHQRDQRHDLRLG